MNICFEKALLNYTPKVYQPRKFELNKVFSQGDVSGSRLNYFLFILASKGLLNSKNLYKEQSLNDEHTDFIHNYTKFIFGYFQNYNYVDLVWKSQCEKILELLDFNKEVNKDYIAVHIRLGDYRTSEVAKSYHGTLDVQYYEVAINKLADLMNFKGIQIVSDEILIAQELFKKYTFPAPVSYISSSNHFKDLRVIGNAKGVVMSNSSFSWWGAYIASKINSAKVVAPDLWFKNSSKDEPRNLIKPDWMRVPRYYS